MKVVKEKTSKPAPTESKGISHQSVTVACSHPVTNSTMIETLKRRYNATRPLYRGIFLALAASAFFASMHAVVRYVSDDMHAFEIAFFRNLFGFAVMLPLLIRAGPGRLKSHQPGLQFVRGIMGLMAMLTWFYGLSLVPIAQATALSFAATLYATIGAAFFLSERIRLRRWSALLVGFCGTLIVLRPGLLDIHIGTLAVIFSSVCWGMSLVVIKKLTRTDSTVSMVGWMTIMLTLGSLPPALAVWTMPSAEQIAWLVLVGILGTFGHLASISAFKLADATALFPFDFMRLVWASLIGFMAFSEVPDVWTWVGGGVIIASASYITWRESQARKSE
jgi:drug/metabolite transporter (DMT)-like permease